MSTPETRLEAYNRRRAGAAKPTDPRVEAGARAVYEAEGNTRTYEEFKEKQRHLSGVYAEEAQIVITAADKLVAETSVIGTVVALAELPRGAYVQGYDGFRHAKVSRDLWLLCVDAPELRPHPSKDIRLPATRLDRAAP